MFSSSTAAAAQQQQHSSSSTAAAAQQQQHSSSVGGDVELLFLVPAPRVKPERQMKKMQHPSGTFFRDSLHIMHCGSALRIVLRDASRIVEQQKQQQHSSSGGSDVVATDEKDERGYTGELFVFVLALWRNLKRTSADTPQKSSVNHCCFTVPLNTLRLHTR